ncbi:MAG: hypothetical protein JST35_01325 [Armatimonadetes bacterium]|nr:hypothetical protein [Armatimonadota bacterium]
MTGGKAKLMAAAGVVLFVAGWLTYREWNWDRDRATFHQDRAPKVIAQFNQWFSVKLGSHLWMDTFDSYSSQTCSYTTEYELIGENGQVGTVTAYGYSDYPTAVTCMYELDLKKAPKSEFLKVLLNQPTSVIRQDEDLLMYNAGSSHGRATFFIGPSNAALERLKEKGEPLKLPTKMPR